VGSSRGSFCYFFGIFFFCFRAIINFLREFRFQIGELTYPGSLQERKKKVLLNSLHENQRIANRGVNSNTHFSRQFGSLPYHLFGNITSNDVMQFLIVCVFHTMQFM